MHGIEEEERGDGIAAHAPDAALDLPRGDAHADPHRRVHEEVHLLLVPLVQRITVRPDPLGDVALGPAQPDADHGKAEVARRFHEVAREDAESAGVGGELLVQAVLHGEVRDEGHQGSQSSTRLPSGSRMKARRLPSISLRRIAPPRDSISFRMASKRKTRTAMWLSRPMGARAGSGRNEAWAGTIRCSCAPPTRYHTPGKPRSGRASSGQPRMPP